ncbi:MAG: GNAT family N-acetyltransferase [Alphaproteobacteria bacterium]|nr:GNAT family N-acetyltransferase [Alphaproteobacteria bacterium]
MAGIPLTRNRVSPEREAAIRAAVREQTGLPGPESDSRLAQPEDAPAVFRFLSDPAVFAPIYSLPRPLTEDTVRDWIKAHLAERAAGTGLLFLRADEAGEITGYSDFQVWPQWAAGELGGALRADRQSQGQGGAGAKTSFTWMFEALGLDLICSTASLDNVRTARLLDHLGFERMGEVESKRPDGSTRASLVWEVSREAWFKPA